jgi:hypothetical protein
MSPVGFADWDSTIPAVARAENTSDDLDKSYFVAMREQGYNLAPAASTKHPHENDVKDQKHRLFA